MGRPVRGVSHLAPKDIVRFHFPLTQRSVNETIGSVEYALELRGNTVVDIDPPGTNIPFCQDGTGA